MWLERTTGNPIRRYAFSTTLLLLHVVTSAFLNFQWDNSRRIFLMLNHLPPTFEA
uniref:Uncharacterized protein n=1 Tax=Klebsiella pneumoniae TaxID=573 RepID=A0A8B0SVA7_KLEPN|nr:hypothetical protein [Klebsiella pneumoniae]